MKLLLDFLPLILFFAAYKFGDIFIATAVAIVGTLLATAFTKLQGGKVDKMQWVSLGIVVVLGGATLITHNETFIKWKPTVFYWFVALALMAGQWLFRKNILKSLIGHQLQLPEHAWLVLTLSWTVFFAVMGALNLWIAFTFSEATWVNFKVFGGMGLMVLFIIAQAFYLRNHIQYPDGEDAEKPAAEETPESSG